MTAPELTPAIGLFGTTGQSRWRKAVIRRLQAENIAYFDPTVAEGWTPAQAEIEATHLATDKVILFVITAETPAFGSLAESGWAAVSAARNGQAIFFVVEERPSSPSWWQRLLVADTPDQASQRARILIRHHMQKAGFPLFDTVEEALEAAIQAYRSS